MKTVQKTFKHQFSASYRRMPVQFLVAPTLIWHHRKRGDIDAFMISLAVHNQSLDALGYHRWKDGGSWTEVAHSDHNPVDGHDIYDRKDPKQLHVDVNHPFKRGYVEVYKKLSKGAHQDLQGKP